MSTENKSAVNYDRNILLFLTFIGCIIRLYKIGTPPAVVFDEVHFGGFVSKYIQGSFLQDVHPPLGKIMLTLGAIFAGYNGQFAFKSESQEIGLEYSNQVPYVIMRSIPAIFGVLVIPMAYMTLRNMKCSKTSSLVGAAMVLFDNALVT